MSVTKILLSGGNSGIGYEIAKKLLTDHTNIHLFLGSRTLSNGTAAVSTLNEVSHPSNTTIAVQLDLTSDDSIESCISTIKSHTPYLDVLINNAGIAPIAQDSSLASVRTAFNNAYNTNVTGTSLLTDACIPLFSASPNVPRLLFITSGLSSLSRVSGMGRDVVPTTTPASSNATGSSAATLAHADTRTSTIAFRPYVVSKCAMNMLAVSYSVQFRDVGWKVNLVCPGLRKTKLNNYMERATDPALGALEAVNLAMDGSATVDGAKEKEVGRSGGMWDWDGSEVAW